MRLREVHFEVQSIQKMLRNLKDEQRNFQMSGAMDRCVEAIMVVLRRNARELHLREHEDKHSNEQLLRQYDELLLRAARLENEKKEAEGRHGALETRLRDADARREKAEELVRRLSQLPLLGKYSFSAEKGERNSTVLCYAAFVQGRLSPLPETLSKPSVLRCPSSNTRLTTPRTP